MNKNVVLADVRCYKSAMPHVAVPEYDQYAEVLFMNEGALMICNDYELRVNVLKVVAEQELPEGLGIQWQKPYLPYNKNSGKLL